MKRYPLIIKRASSKMLLRYLQKFRTIGELNVNRNEVFDGVNRV